MVRVAIIYTDQAGFLDEAVLPHYTFKVGTSATPFLPSRLPVKVI